MRNFYTVLDFDHNYIILGLNLGAKGASTASINGNNEKVVEEIKEKYDETAGQRTEKSNGGVVAFFIIVFLILGGGAAFIWYRKRKENKNVFAKTTGKHQGPTEDLKNEKTLLQEPLEETKEEEKLNA